MIRRHMSGAGLSRGAGDGSAGVHRFLRALRHPVRIAAVAIAAMALTSALTSTAGVLAAMLGAALGVVAGELLGRSRIRLAALLLVEAGLLAMVWVIAWSLTYFSLFPSLVGPSLALTIETVFRFATLAMIVVSTVRSVAIRRPAVMALELVALAGALSAMFAAHRNAMVERPVWLADWAWQHELDPSKLLLGIGAAAVVVLGALLLLERGRRLSLLTFVVLIVLSTATVSILDLSELEEPDIDHELGLTEEVEGERPHRTPPGVHEGGHEGHQDGGVSGGEEEDSGLEQEERAREDAGGAGTGEETEAGVGEGGEQVDAGESAGGDGGLEEEDDEVGEGEGDAGGAEGADGGAAEAAESERQSGGEESSEGGDEAEGEPESGSGSGSENLDDRSDAPPSQSPSPMAVVLLEDDYSPESQAYYFRQGVWSEYTGNRLVPARREDVDLDVMREFPSSRRRVRQPPRPEGRRLIHGRVALLADHSGPFALEAPLLYQPLSNPNPARFHRVYGFQSLAQTLPYRRLPGRRLGDPSWSAEVRQHYLEGPDDERYRELAEEIVNRLPLGVRDDPFTRALAVKLYLDQETTYSTSERHAGVEDPTAHMLFGNRTGYCVHFAHAAVYLWRALGIPARVGTGYSVPEDHRRGSVVMVRANDGHAWPELYVEGLGWTVLDIAPARNLDPPAQPIDEEMQEMLGDMARETPADPEEPDRDEPWLRSAARIVADVVLAALFLCISFLYVFKIWRRLIPRVESGEHLPRVGYRYSIDLLAEAGFSRERGETRESFAHRLREIVPELERLTAWHMAARFADPRGPVERRVEFDAEGWHLALERFRGQLRRQVPWYRRALGGLNPFSLFYSR